MIFSFEDKSSEKIFVGQRKTDEQNKKIIICKYNAELS